MHKLALSVLAYVRKRDLLRPGDRVGVAVSGGADSVALLRILLELRHELGVVLSVVHLNHTLRGVESYADEQFVRELAKAHELQFFCESRDVKTCATEKKLSIETAARELRYEYFEEFLRKGEFSKLATAHTINDQAETVLLRLVRGTGFRGLGGIRPRLVVEDMGEEPCGAIVRCPCFSARRESVLNYLKELPQTWREDATNQDPKHTRNRIRRQLMPLLQQEFNSAVVERFADLAEVAYGEEEFWDNQCNDSLARLVTMRPPDWAGFYGPVASVAPFVPEPAVIEKIKQPGPMIVNLAIDLPKFRDVPLGAQRRLIQSLESFGMPLEFQHIDSIIQLSTDESGLTREIRLPWG